MNSLNKQNNEVTQQPTENWVTVKNHPRYEVSDLGRVRSTTKKDKVKIIKPSENSTNKDKRDYLFYTLNGVKHYAHHLVLSHFVGEKPKGYECDHINGDKHNNTLINLRYLTIAENRSHKGEEHPKSKLNNHKVKQIKLLYSLKKELNLDQKKIADLFDVTPSAISSVITNKSWNHVN